MPNLQELKSLVEIPAFRLDIEYIFFEAMNAGYAAEGKPKKGSITELPGSKTITYTKGPWVVLDVYQVTPISSFSGGTTHIWYKGIEVWMMQYFGKYEERAIPCLKAALRATYEKEEFVGGRGPRKLVLGKYAYENHPVLSTFEMFSGFESVVEGAAGDGVIRGTHQYHGGLMI